MHIPKYHVTSTATSHDQSCDIIVILRLWFSQWGKIQYVHIVCAPSQLREDTSSDGSAILEHLQRADTMSRNLAVAEDLTATALAAKTRKDTKPKFTCSYHKTNATHDTKDCHFLNSKKDGAAKATASSPSPNLSFSEQAMMAQIAHCSSSPL